MSVNHVQQSNGVTIMDSRPATVTVEDLALGVKAMDMHGEIIEGTSTKDSDTSEDTATAGEILATKTAHARGGQLVGTMPNIGTQTSTIVTKDQQVAISRGYHGGDGTVGISTNEQAKLIPENIKEGVTLLGVEGTMSGDEDVVAQTKSVTPSFEDQQILPDVGYTHISGVNLGRIEVVLSDNAAGGQTATIQGAAYGN